MKQAILVIAGISLGVVIATFVLRGHRQQPAPIINGYAGAPATEPARGTRSALSSKQETPAEQKSLTAVFINGRELTKVQALGIARVYGYAPAPGHYWYDTVSGAWGLQGHEAAGFLLPGYDFGPLAVNASNGNTGVFINGREINMLEAMRIQQTFGAVYRGRWWLDGRTGNYGIEGNPMPMGNIVAALQAQRSGRGGDNFWCSVTACGNDNGQSGYVDVGGTIVGYDH